MNEASRTPQDPPPSSETGGAAVPQACAACKHQRRRCKPDCPLAPYFPAEKRTEFLNAHKLFGVGNLVKILRSVRPNERDDAMKSAIYEANARTVDPVRGCHGIIRELEKRIGILELELESIRSVLAVYRTAGGGGSRLQTQLCLNRGGVYDPYVKGKQVVHVRAGNDDRHVSESSAEFVQNIRRGGGSSDEPESIKDGMIEQYLNDRAGEREEEDIKPGLLNSGSRVGLTELDSG